MKIKLMNYNIRHGFHGSIKPFVLHEERQKVVQEIVKKENPDVLVLTEACFGHENKYGINVDYKRLFGYPYYLHASSKPVDYEWGSAILSRYPVTGENLGQEWLSFLRSQINLNGESVNLDVFHPYPNITDQEKLVFLNKHLKGQMKNYILAGDFNSISPKEYDREKLLRGFKTFAKEPEKEVAGLLKGQTVYSLVSRGLVDTYKQVNDGFDYTIPTDLISKNKDSGLRLDYIFCSPDWLVRDARIIRNKYTEKASDHYPVVAELELKK